MPTTSIVEFKMLDVSTAHLSPETRKLLETFDVSGVLFYPKGPWGWFVNVPARDDDLVVGNEVPADLKNCMEFAQAQQKDWIMFDCDGTVMPELPCFGDEQVPCGTRSNHLDQLAQAFARHLSVRYNRNVKATFTSDGKISVKDDLENGMYALVSVDFVQAMMMQHLPVVEMEKLQASTA